VAVDPNTSGPRVIAVQDGGVVEVHRDAEAEKAFAAMLLQHDFLPVTEARFGVPEQHRHDLIADGDELAWYDVMYHDIPKLKSQGWRIEVDKDFPFRIVSGAGDFSAEIREGSGIDWLELDLGVIIDGERIDLIPAILAMIARGGHRAALDSSEPGQPFYLPLKDGRLLALPSERLAPIVAALYELASGGATPSDASTMRLSAADAAGLAEFEDATARSGLVWRGGDNIRAMGAKLKAAGGIPPVALPDSFKAVLRPYQAQGVAWLQFLREVGLGGILADDMGLGKTVQALAVITIEKEEGRLNRPVLIIAPTSLMANWRREAERFAPDLKVLTLQGLDRKKHFAEIAQNDIVLSTYPLLARDHAILGAQPWHMVFLDEAQTIKNPDATTTKLLAKLEARHRFCLTGTPLENHLGELWSLFSFASPGFLGDRKSFTSAYRTPIEKKGDAERSRLLAKRIKPFLLRRSKAEVALDLPPKTEIAERVEFADGQRGIYESIRLLMHDKVRQAIADKGFARSRIVILDALLKLRQACCDPRLLKLKAGSAEKAGSAKLDRLKEMIDELVTEGRRVLVFSQFTSMLDLIRPELDKLAIAYALLTGDTREREPVIRSFQDGNVPVFLVSLKAGGVGLNLTAADTVIIYDPWWNPAVESQAIDRAHRIGQNKPVFVHRLVAQGTIEEKMEVLKEKKRHLADSLFDSDGAPTLAMTEEDLNMLLSPG
jgi:superfamily II DNA or RNA helicase